MWGAKEQEVKSHRNEGEVGEGKATWEKEKAHGSKSEKKQRKSFERQRIRLGNSETGMERTRTEKTHFSETVQLVSVCLPETTLCIGPVESLSWCLALL